MCVCAHACVSESVFLKMFDVSVCVKVCMHVSICVSESV